jgi:phosphate transport system substrate-binding protein
MKLSQFILVSVLSTSFSIAGYASQQDTLSWAGCGITKKSFMKELAAAYTSKTGIKINLQGGGATRGIRDTVTNKLDIGGSCRMTLPGYEKSEFHASLHPIAWDALVAITHKSNSVKNLTTGQIKAIYTGKITNWNEVGGANAPIQLYVRRGKISGVGYAIRQYIFKNSQVEFKSNHIVRSSRPLEKAVETDPDAFGITGISSAKKRDLHLLKIDNKTPSFENIKNGSYGFYRPLYLVSNHTPSKKVRNFIHFATSNEGRRIIRNSGTVPYMDAPKLLSKMLIYGFGVQ